MTTLDTLIHEAMTIRQQAYAPYSNFQVGAAILTANQHIFTGCNIENVAYGLTQCAEATAIGQMIVAGKGTIAEIAICGSTELPCSPCGACRQRILEFATPDTLVHICNNVTLVKSLPLKALLPESFGPENLVKG